MDCEVQIFKCMLICEGLVSRSCTHFSAFVHNFTIQSLLVDGLLARESCRF